MPAPETTAPASAEPAAREALEWSVWPARERPWAAGVLLASLAVLALLIVQATGDRVLAVAAPVFILISVGSFISRTHYRLTAHGIEVNELVSLRSDAESLTTSNGEPPLALLDPNPDRPVQRFPGAAVGRNAPGDRG